MVYEFVQMIEGSMVSTVTASIEDAATLIDLTINGVETRTNLRPCLRGQPKIEGFVGPCYGGEVNGKPVIRYEDQATYLAMGC